MHKSISNKVIGAANLIISFENWMFGKVYFFNAAIFGQNIS